MPWSVTYVSPFTCIGIISRSKRPSSVAWCGELVRADGELVELGPRDLVLLGDHLRADALALDRVLLEQLGREGEAEVLLGLHARGERQLAHVLDAAADDDVVHAGGDLRGREVHGLLRRAALEVDRRGRRLDREARLEPGVAPDVEALRPELHHAARDHVLHLARVDAGALDHRAVGGAQQLVGVGVLVVALLEVPSPDRACGPPRRLRPRVRPGGHCHSSPFQVPPAAVFGGGRGHMLRAPMTGKDRHRRQRGHRHRHRAGRRPSTETSCSGRARRSPRTGRGTRSTPRSSPIWRRSPTARS